MDDFKTMDAALLEQQLNYRFADKDRLIQALTHKSHTHETGASDNERLEFLGDTVLQFVISDLLMARYPRMSEGMMSKFRAVLVSEQGLAKVARKLDLGAYLWIGKGEEITGGRQKTSLLTDALEAMLAAVYLDSKEQGQTLAVSKVIHHLFIEEIIEAEATFAVQDHKTLVQEWVQRRKLGFVEYVVVKETGPDHEKEFVTELRVRGRGYGQGIGKSKKISEQKAAMSALNRLKKYR